MSEEKHILTKLETIYFGKKENEKLTMHEIGVALDYVALLEQNNRYKNEEIKKLHSIIKEVREYIETKTLCFAPLKNYQVGKDILEILDKEE